MKRPSIVLACDVGGTRIKLGLVQAGRLLARRELAAHQTEGLTSALRRVAKGAGQLCKNAGVNAKTVNGFGLTFPGIIEPETERILSSPAGKFDDAKSLDVPELVQKLLGLPARICNDANAALAGEWRYGAARGCRSAVIMTLGTGIGTSAIINGIPLRGEHGQAGTLGGHFVANLMGRLCNCGNLGCVETEVATWALPDLLRGHRRFRGSTLAQAKTLDYAAVFRAAHAGDPLGVEFRNRAIQVWSAALVSLIHAYDPERAIIGGGIMRSAEAILPSLRHYVEEHAWTPWGKVEVRSAELGNNAGLIGAAWLFKGHA